MPNIGQLNKLCVTKLVDFGAYLDGGDLGEILLPKRNCPENIDIGDILEVFLHHDSEDRLIATTEKPRAYAGDFARLKVIDKNKIGFFLDWGLSKDLLLPFSEVKQELEIGRYCLVRLFIDERTSRITASAKLDEFLDEFSFAFEEGQQVNLIIKRKTELGYEAIINNTAIGLLYDNEIFQTLYIGDKLTGFIKQTRRDGKIDLILQQDSYKLIDPVAEKIMTHLNNHDGVMNITDKSSPEIIKKTFHVSKSTFKKALGTLYKSRQIILEKNSVRKTDV